MDPSAGAIAARTIARSLVKPVLHVRFPIAFQRRWLNLLAPALIPARGLLHEPIKLAGVPTERVRAKTGESSALAILYLHGGAFVTCSPATHRGVTSRLAKLSGSTLFAPDYRLAPEHPFPAALDDALACYLALQEQGFTPENIVLAGDSAGGNLALSLCLTLCDRGLSQPVRLALISPWADLTLSDLASVSDDPFLNASWLAQASAAYLQGRQAREPLVSPLYGDLSGLPPTLIHSASDEILRNDSRRLAAALARAGVSTIHREFAGMWHGFQLYAHLVPDAAEALGEMARFARV
jgi:acetyl esterase/lipase